MCCRLRFSVHHVVNAKTCRTRDCLKQIQRTSNQTGIHKSEIRVKNCSLCSKRFCDARVRIDPTGRWLGRDFQISTIHVWDAPLAGAAYQLPARTFLSSVR
eukprot:1185230-Prorocentrum_minimum.AAC.2